MNTPRIHKEFLAMVPRPSPEQYDQLKQDMIAHGQKDPIELWDKTKHIVDGYTRHQINQELGRPSKTVLKHFENEDEVKLYIYQKNLFRRQLDETQRVVLALAARPLIEKLAAARKKAGKTIGQNHPKGRVVDQIAKLAGVSSSTVVYHEKVRKDDPKLYEKVVSGEKTVSRAYKEIVIKENLKLPRMSIPKGQWNVIVYDPAWPFGNLVSGGSGTSGQAQKYRPETIEEMKNHAVWKAAAKNAILFLWALPTHHFEATEVIKASGFKPLTKLYWDKMEIKQGYNFRNSVEECIVCVKGDVKAFGMSGQENIIHEKPERIHSRKPEKFFEIFVEAAKRGLPGQELKMIEINATQKRAGWTTVGNQIESFPEFCKRQEEIKFNEMGYSKNIGKYLCVKCRKGKHSECSQYNIPNSACNCKHGKPRIKKIKSVTVACKDCLEVFHSVDALKAHKPNCPKAKFTQHINAETGQKMFSCNKLCVHQVKK